MIDDQRPDPEELLARANAEEKRKHRGKLKIFFGFAAGVGKTYAMLEAARAEVKGGRDVVIGWIETHGRAETEALTAGLPRIPPRALAVRDRQLSEFDLDGTLARRPRLVLVDEYAHSNVTGSRHTKRWQDVEELLDAGIDVWTTLNVQHVESLNDVVAQVTHIQVQETIPDSAFDKADEVELVDLPPDELIRRLREGKVYVPEQIERAIDHFFKKGNLIALRELALRRTAERVDEQALEWRRDKGVTETWATAERIMVAVGPGPRSADLVRAARRMAARLKAPWIALSVETPDFDLLPQDERERASFHLMLAERLGAETLVVRGESAADEILTAARERNVTRIIVGKPQEGGRGWRVRSMVDELVRRSGGIDVLVTTGERPAQPETGSYAAATTAKLDPWPEYALAAGGTLAATALCLATRSIFVLADQVMIHLLAVVLVSMRVGRWPAVFASVLGVAAVDFCFVEPFYTFNVSDLRYIVTFAVMLLTGYVVSTLTVRNRIHAEAARSRERRTAALYAMGRDFLAAKTAGQIGEAAARRIRDLFEADAAVLLSEGQELKPAAGEGRAQEPQSRDLAVAQWALHHKEAAGHGTNTLPGTETLYLPLVGSSGPLGVFGIALGRRPAPLSPSQRQLLETFVAQTALALERVQWEEEAAASRVAVETERTRNSLLSAVSHDLRTPLASIAGSTDVLLDAGSRLDETKRTELLETIRGETSRLNRLVQDLLELTRLESGTLQVRKEWCPVEELLASALGRLRSVTEGRAVSVDVPHEVLMVPVDELLVEQVLINVVENAAKYSPDGSPIEIRANTTGNEVRIDVADRGPGIQYEDRERVFERFYRAPDGGRIPGTGLGLAICRAAMRAHGGTIEIIGREGGGSIFRLTLPLDGAPPRPPVDGAGGPDAHARAES